MENLSRYKDEHKKQLMQNAESKLKEILKDILECHNLKVYDIVYNETRILYIYVYIDWDLYIKLSDLIKAKEEFKARDARVNNSVFDKCSFIIEYPQINLL